jgi:hypothetical protein
MAAPSAPANVTVKRGRNAQSVRLGCDTTAGATAYTFYWSNQSGVTTANPKGKRSSQKNYVEIDGLNYRKVFAVATGTNVAGEESVAGGEATGRAGE